MAMAKKDMSQTCLKHSCLSITAPDKLVISSFVLAIDHLSSWLCGGCHA